MWIQVCMKKIQRDRFRGSDQSRLIGEIFIEENFSRALWKLQSNEPTYSIKGWVVT